MSDFDSQFSECAVPAIADQFEDTDAVTYTPKVGSASTFDATVGPLELERRKNPKTGALVNVRVRSVLVRTSVKARSAIATNGTITIDSHKYEITHIGDDATGWYEIQLEELRRGEVTRDGYRKTLTSDL